MLLGLTRYLEFPVRMNCRLVVFICLIVQGNIVQSHGLLSWLFGGFKKSSRAAETVSGGEVMAAQKHAPFEMQTADEKFLMEANFVQDLSPLDLCHHRVVAVLRSTCADLNEEDMAKLSVHLLNCQSKAEKRKTYPCSDDMTIAECTADMDPTTWNAYQIVSNRARAICYGTRQQQFRLKTEHTVNHLVHTTAGQLQAMKVIQEGQAELGKTTKDTLQGVESGQKELLRNQDRLKSAHVNIHTQLTGNMRDLLKEKALIASGNQQLAEMTDGIKKKIDLANEKLDEQEQAQQENHQEILADLSAIRDRAKEVWEKLDDSSKHVLQFHNETKQHYKETLSNLQKVNGTINYVLDTLQDMRGSLDQKINWIMDLIGCTGNRVALLSTLVLHVTYLLLAALSAAFLRTPTFSRLVLLVMVPLNAWAEIRQGQSLGFLAMTLFILLTVAGNWATSCMWHLCTHRKTKGAALCQSPNKPLAVKALHPEKKASTPNGNDQTPPGGSKPRSPLGSFMTQGLASPDVRRLVNILEKLYTSGVFSPAPSAHGTPTAVVTPMAKPALNKSVSAPTPLQPPPTPASDQPCRPIPMHLPPSPDHDEENGGESKEPEPSSIALVKKHLLSSLENGGGPAGSPTRRASRPSHRPSLTSTPVKGSPRGSRSSTPNRSVSRPLCLATTRSGFPCKLGSSEGSAFCYKHQVAL